MSAVFGATFTVTNNAASGAGSLHQAILDANANSGTDTIVFNIGGGGLQLINQTTDLPGITDPAIIDATTQPGYSGNPIIELKGTGPSGTSGFAITAGNTTIRGFIINNFHFSGITISTNGGNIIQGNFIGTNIAGTSFIRNWDAGITINNSSNNLIGGTSPGARNLISGNQWEGILIRGASSDNIIRGNYIGMNVSGTEAIANQREGICICRSNSASNNLIGGTATGAGNLIAGNLFDEIEIGGTGTGNTVQGNLIGTNPSATQTFPSPGYGILLVGGSNNIIGGTQAGAGNVIAGSMFGSVPGTNGIHIQLSSGNTIQGNSIGTDATGTISLPNQGAGIHIWEYARNNVIGGIAPGAGNKIAFNGNAGILLSTTTGAVTPTRFNTIRGNSIYSNAALGIDIATNIGTGVTPNDSCDADTGEFLIVNEMQNYPVLISAGRSGSTINITGTLNSVPSATFAIDFYSDPSGDPTGFGEGKVYLGTTNVTTGGTCSGFFSAVLPYSGEGQFITATATDANGNTSEFAQSMQDSIASRKTVFDFEGDGKSDISIYRPSVGEWWYLRSSDGQNAAFQFGRNSDKIVPADFTGDGKTDVAIFRPSSGEWFILRSEDQSYYSFPFGNAQDIPAPGDFDGDGKADPAVFRPSTGTWYISRSSGGTTIQQFGQNGDAPVVADYDGDGKSDMAIYRVSSGEWWIQRSAAGLIAYQFGNSSDRPVQGDYTGDGKADIALFRPSSGNWFILRSEDQSYYSFPFGTSGDIPAPGDFDGDGKFDATVFRPSTSTWFIQRSTAGTLIQSFGAPGDVPVPNAFVP